MHQIASLYSKRTKVYETKIDYEVIKKFYDQFVEDISKEYNWMRSIGFDILDNYEKHHLDFIEKHANASGCKNFKDNFYRIQGANKLFLDLVKYIQDSDAKLREQKKQREYYERKKERLSNTVSN